LSESIQLDETQNDKQKDKHSSLFFIGFSEKEASFQLTPADNVEKLFSSSFDSLAR